MRTSVQTAPDRVERRVRDRRSSADVAAVCAETAIFVADTLSGMWLEREWDRDAIRALVERAAGTARVPADTLQLQVALRILRDPELMEYPPGVAIAAQLRRLLVLGPLDHVSVWVRGDGDEIVCLESAGAEGVDAAAEALAARAILPEEERPAAPAAAGPLLAAIPVLRWQQPYAAIVGRATGTAQRQQFHLLLGETTGIIGAVIEREALLRRNASKEHALVEASERGLERLGLDLHDRPVQDIACLADDLRHLKVQLGYVLDGHPKAGVALDRFDDLEARLTVIHSQLRELSHGLVAPVALHRPLAELLESELCGFRALTDIELRMDVEGDLERLTTSQRIAILRIVQEALSNVREHGGASRVEVSVRGHSTHVEADIRDDGRGFDVAETMADAARRGRLGLVGMTERARLLGGHCEISSAPGRSTCIRVRLPRWDDSAARPAAPVSRRA